MFQRHFQPRAIVALGALFAGTIALGSGCSSSNGGPASSGASSGSSASGDVSDAATVPLHRGDAAIVMMSTADTGASAASGLYDGTVGQTCTSDVDCQPAGGAGLNVCSSSIKTGVLFPTPVCVLTSCDPGSDGNLHFCDGPDMPTSPGVCFPLSGGQGFCLPQCELLTDGKAPVGCPAGSACAQLAIGVDTNGDIAGAFGACLSACVQDADCPSGTKCQVDTGGCVTAVVPPTKAPGAPCTDTDTTMGACDCFSAALTDGGTSAGVCAPSCVTGPTAACPAGFVCDALLETNFTGANDASLGGFTLQNPGLIGRCFQACSAGAGEGDATTSVGADAGGTCAAPTKCATFETAGEDCLPL